MFLRLISCFVAVSFAVVIGGCGGGGGSSADPLGTDSLAFTDAAGSATPQVSAGGVLTLKATVRSASGRAVVGREVSFMFGSNASGATLVSSIASTNSAGEATILFTAGARAGLDVVRASISNGAAMDVSITVSSPAGAGGRQVTLAGSPTSLAAGKNSLLTATVMDSSGNLLSGQTVAFSFAINKSGAPALTVLNLGLTDAGGRAVAIYSAGATDPGAEVQDIVKAEIAGTASSALTLTRTASTAVPPAVYRLSLAANVTSLAAGQSAVVTATVTDGSGDPANGQAVTFALLSNNSGATLVALNGGITDSSGRVAAVYTAGATSPASNLQDTVQASVTGSTGAVVMTRTAAGGGGGTGLRMTVTATPTSLIAGAMSVIVAQVNNADGTPATAQAVTFGFVANANRSGATLTALNATTDANGTAIAAYMAGNNSPGLSVQDAVSASVTGSAGAAIITRLPATGTGNRISLDLTPSTLPTTTSNAVVSATVLRDDNASPVPNETVTFSIITGGGTIAPLTATTNNSGIANAVFTAPGGATGFEAVVRAEILGTTNGGDAVGIIYW